jgi:outer membrane protein insertion porin family
MRLQIKWTFQVAACLLILCFNLAAQQNFKIAKIEFEGLNKLSSDEMIATTELKVGQQFELSALDAAAQRLIDSGYFKNVAYRTKPNRDQITITFVVEEAKVSTSRVIFDNFIWFTDSELIAAVKKDVPSFSGTAPDNGDTVERITRSLQTFLHENKIEATVSYMASQDDPGSSRQEHVFSVTGIPMPICTIHFPGANNISEAKLIESSKSLIGNDYSHKFVSLFSANTLFPLYREVGQLKAAFAPPGAKPEATANCKAGVELTIPVDEGLVYKWDKAEWYGNTALKNEELNALLGMQPGQVANGNKVDKATKEIHKAYGRKGYLAASVRSVSQFNDADQTVIFRMDVREGPQFRMGRFTTKGFPETIDKALHDRWSLKTGDVFDQGYALEFSQKQMGEVTRPIFLERRAQNKSAPNLKFDNKMDQANLTVDVTLELAN